MTWYFYLYAPAVIVAGVAVLAAAPALALALLAIGLYFGVVALVRESISLTHRLSRAVRHESAPHHADVTVV
jgi:hypothetical protein